MKRFWQWLWITGSILALAACQTGQSTQVVEDDILDIPQPFSESDRISQEYEYFEVEFDDLIPEELMVSLQQCWNGMGMDTQGRIYIGFTSSRDRGKTEDFVIFRYDPATGQREFLGSYQDIAASFDNLEEGESIPKGHTRMIEYNGVMYMGSQGFHDFKWEIDDLSQYRGGHLFGYEIASDRWTDFSASMDGGVVLKHQGIVGLSILPGQGQLVGIAHPLSDLVLFDLASQSVAEIIPGIPWKLGNPLSREVIVAPSGNIYTYRGTEDLSQRNEVHPVWKYDAQTGDLSQTDVEMTQGFWIGQTQTRDGSAIYVTTVNGQMYRFDTADETFTDLGTMLPEDEILHGRRIQYQYGPTLSPDEQKIYYVVSTLEDWEGSGELYEYDLATGEYSFVMQLPVGIYTAADLRDDDYIYFAHFGSPTNLWSGRARLIAIDVP